MNSIKKFLDTIENKKRKDESLKLITIVERASGYKPKLRGQLICYGKYHYKYESGHEGDSAVVAFSPRKAHLVVYFMPGFSNYQKLTEKLGKYKHGKSCLYINKLEDIDIKVLEKLISASVKEMQSKYDCTSD